MQAGMGITDGIIQGKISCFRNKFHKHKEKCSEKRKFLGALCLRSEGVWNTDTLKRFIVTVRIILFDYELAFCDFRAII